MIAICNPCSARVPRGEKNSTSFNTTNLVSRGDRNIKSVRGGSTNSSYNSNNWRTSCHKNSLFAFLLGVE